MKHLHKAIAAKTLLCSLSLFLVLTASSPAQELDRSTADRGVNPAVDVSVHPEFTGEAAAQSANSRTTLPASTFGVSRAKPLSATTGSHSAPKAQAPLAQPFNSTNQGGSPDTQSNAGTLAARPPSTPEKHVARSYGGAAPPPARAHLGFAATQPHFGGSQSISSVHHSSGKRSAHASNKLFTSRHNSLDQGITTESKLSTTHSAKSKLKKLPTE